MVEVWVKDEVWESKEEVSVQVLSNIELVEDFFVTFITFRLENIWLITKPRLVWRDRHSTGDSSSKPHITPTILEIFNYQFVDLNTKPERRRRQVNFNKLNV